MSPLVRRTALILAGAALTQVLAACQAAARPFSRFASSAPSEGACDPNGHATLRVVNQSGKPYEIHVARRGTARVWIARAPVGASTITVLGPSDYTARYSVVQRDKPVTESSVSWRNRTLNEQGLVLELQCTPASGIADKAE